MEALFNDPQKLGQFEQAMMGFVNKHLDPIGRTITEIIDLSSGVNFVLLCASLGNFHPPAYTYILKPITPADHRMNMEYVFELLKELKVSTRNCDIGDIIKGDKKATLKLLYSIFKTFK
uniref:Alpha-parvin (Trinotate prediction) n=1 Tax=Myxobolus squamalis TaxID=59785 RepID=A0A6B2G2G3_MYXSQ